jgi:Ca2+-binding RTX toxin-like protein
VANLLFSQVKADRKIDLSKDALQIDTASAFDAALSELRGNVQLTIAGKTVVFTNWSFDKLTTSLVSFVDNSELIMGDNQVANTNDGNAQNIASSAPGTAHNDQMRGLGGDDTISGGKGNDLLFGNDGDDTLNGDDDNDIIEAGRGNDTVNGGDGDDVVRIDQPRTGNDTVQGGAGKDKLLYEGASLTTIQTLDGGAGNDKIEGGNGNDVLMGGADKDRIFGNDGDDTIIGGLGSDKYTGGGGKDTFRVGAGEAGASPPLCDTATDFTTREDVFDLIVAGTANNYAEDDIASDDFNVAFTRASELMQQSDGARVLVFIAGINQGWLFGDIDMHDMVPDTAIFLEGRGALRDMRFADII